MTERERRRGEVKGKEKDLKWKTWKPFKDFSQGRYTARLQFKRAVWQSYGAQM